MGHSSGKTNEFSADVAPDVILGLGGNLGDVRMNLSSAIRRVSESFRILAVSPLYSTAPVGPPQPDFLNAAIGIAGCSDLSALLSELQDIERTLGRVRLEKWGPRTVDLDILWARGKTIATSSLTVPHAELQNRAFALRPLLDVYSAAKDPRDGCSYQEVFDSLPPFSMERIAQGHWWEALPPL